MLAFCSTRELHGPHNAGLAQDVCYGLKGFILAHSKPLGSWQETGAAVGVDCLVGAPKCRSLYHTVHGSRIVGPC